ncbi:MAG: DUF1593 domain-containing protein [Pseudomonadota bacterium]
MPKQPIAMIAWLCGGMLAAALVMPARSATASDTRAKATNPGMPLTVDRHTLPRMIVTTDSEADDINSFIRLLYYSNQLDIEGLIYSSSVHHWKGDGVHTLKQARERGVITSYRGEKAGAAGPSDDALAWRWEPVGWMERKLLQDYSSIYPNLLKHDPNYPSPAELWSKVAVGNITWENDFGADSEGSRRIKAALLDDDRRPLYLQAWGGANTIARALLSIETEYRMAANWSEVRAKVTGKARLVLIGHQDNAYADYIGSAWPGIRVLNFDGVFGGFSSYTRNQVPPSILRYYKSEFWADNIKYGHGPLLEGYGLIGDGTWFEGEGDNPGWQPGQARDPSTFRYFDFLGGFERLDWTGEGDTPAFIMLVPTGLRFIEDPSLGGWGGRLQKSASRDSTFVGAKDLNPHTRQMSGPYTVTRWIPAIAHDFAARADWGMTSRFDEANHAPRIVVKGESDPAAVPGLSVRLAVRADDPDADQLTASWWIYEDAGSLTGSASVIGSRLGRDFTGVVSVPASAKPGERIVVVVDVADDGSPSLTRHAQFVIAVKSSDQQ